MFFAQEKYNNRKYFLLKELRGVCAFELCSWTNTEMVILIKILVIPIYAAMHEYKVLMVGMDQFVVTTDGLSQGVPTNTRLSRVLTNTSPLVNKDNTEYWIG